MRRVVVTGLGIVSSLGNNKSEVLDSLQNFSAGGRVDDAGVRQWLRIAVPEYRDG